MAFWDSWFAPKCDSCGTKIVGQPPIRHEGGSICPTCHEAALAAEAKRKEEADARRAAEEAARARLKEQRRFGTDPRNER